MSVEAVAFSWRPTAPKKAERAVVLVAQVKTKRSSERVAALFLFGAIRVLARCVCAFIRVPLLVAMWRRVVAVSVSEFFLDGVSFTLRQMAWPAARVSKLGESCLLWSSGVTTCLQGPR